MDQVPIVRETELKRRRSRVPWIYLVYHRRLRGSAEAAPPPHTGLPRQSRGAATAGSGEAAKAGEGGLPFLLPSQERRHVERRHRLEFGTEAE